MYKLNKCECCDKRRKSSRFTAVLASLVEAARKKNKLKAKKDKWNAYICKDCATIMKEISDKRLAKSKKDQKRLA